MTDQRNTRKLTAFFRGENPQICLEGTVISSPILNTFDPALSSVKHPSLSVLLYHLAKTPTSIIGRYKLCEETRGLALYLRSQTDWETIDVIDHSKVDMAELGEHIHTLIDPTRSKFVYGDIVVRKNYKGYTVLHRLSEAH